MSVLIVAAHPDDEVLGCGGTIAALRAREVRVTVAILGEGHTSRAETRESATAGGTDALRASSLAAAEQLGGPEVVHFGLPDNRFDSLPLIEIIKPIERLIAEREPATVLTQHGGDLNIDHAQTFRAVLTATRPTVGHAVRSVYAYEVASSTEWALQQFAPRFVPNVFVDIATTLERKLAAMAAYESEARAYPHPRSAPALRAQAQRWGSVAGLEAAEAFQLVRRVGGVDVFSG